MVSLVECFRVQFQLKTKYIYIYTYIHIHIAIVIGVPSQIIEVITMVLLQNPNCIPKPRHARPKPARTADMARATALVSILKVGINGYGAPGVWKGSISGS